MRGTVLFVDDDPWLLEAIRALLKNGPYRVVTVTDPLRALPSIEWEDVDVVVADVEMPGLDGVDLVVRARQLFPRVVRLLLTAGTTADNVIRAVNEGEVFRVLKKPIAADVLSRVLDEALAHRDTLRRVIAVEDAAARRASQIARLEREHPGLGSVFLPDGVYVLAPERRDDLSRRFQGTELEAWLATEDAPAALEQTQDMDEDLADVIVELRDGYGEALPGKAQNLRDTLSRARKMSDTEQVRLVRRQAHSLAGTAGVYGFKETGEAFRRLEQALHELEKVDPGAAESLWETALQRLAEAEQAVARALGR